MALAQLNTSVAWPDCVNIGVAPSVASASLLDASGEYEAVIFCAREAMTITHVAFRNAAAVGSPTADIRIETVDPATGLPSGTLWATNTNIVTSTLTTGWQGTFALTAAATIAAGQIVCVKIVYNTGTSFTPNKLQGSFQKNRSIPYRVVNTGTPTKTVSSDCLCLALGSSSTAFYNVPGLTPVITVAATNLNNGTAGAKAGLRFQVPFACRVAGLRLFNGTATGDYNVAVYDDTTGSAVELGNSSTAFDGDNNLNIATGATDVYFDNPVVLSAGVWYRVAIEPSSATNTTFYLFTLSNANYRSAMQHGLNAHYTTFTTAGGWVDTATAQIPFMDLLIDQLPDTASPGGSHFVGG